MKNRKTEARNDRDERQTVRHVRIDRYIVGETKRHRETDTE